MIKLSFKADNKVPLFRNIWYFGAQWALSDRSYMWGIRREGCVCGESRGW
jgi:hypothetical protein